MGKKFRTNPFFRWCQQPFRVNLFFAIACSGSLTIASGEIAYAQTPIASLDDWRFYPEALQLEFSASAGVTPTYFYLAQPARIVVDIPDTKLGYVPTQQNYYGAIQRIRVSQLKAGTTRIVMDLAPGTFLDRNQVQLQPISRQNNRWVLRPSFTSYNNYPQPGYPPRTSIFSPQPAFNLPPNVYNAPQPNLPPNIYNAPQPPLNVPSNVYNAPQPNLPPNVYNTPQPNLPPNVYNTPQPPISVPPPNIYNAPRQQTVSVPPPYTTFPPNLTNNQQPPSVNVPPLTVNNLPQQPNNILPPANLPNQLGTPNSVAPFPAPNVTVPTYPNSQQNVPDSGIIEFGQPLPNRR
jgi:hypothetical protein